MNYGIQVWATLIGYPNILDNHIPEKGDAFLKTQFLWLWLFATIGLELRIQGPKSVVRATNEVRMERIAPYEDPGYVERRIWTAVSQVDSLDSSLSNT